MKKQYFKIELAPVDMDGLNEIYTNPNLHLQPGSAITVTEDEPPKPKKKRKYRANRPAAERGVSGTQKYCLSRTERPGLGQHTVVVAILLATNEFSWTRAAIRTLVTGRIPNTSISSVISAMIKKGVLIPYE